MHVNTSAHCTERQRTAGLDMRQATRKKGLFVDIQEAAAKVPGKVTEDCAAQTQFLSIVAFGTVELDSPALIYVSARKKPHPRP